MKIIEICEDDELFLEYVRSEIDMLKNLRHKNIIRYLGAKEQQL